MTTTHLIATISPAPEYKIHLLQAQDASDTGGSIPPPAQSPACSEWSGAAGPGCVQVGGSGPGLQRESLHHVSDVGHAGLLGLLLDVLQCAHLQSGTPGGLTTRQVLRACLRVRMKRGL